ncbi:Glutathione S-transferase domain (plasmid) [Paraburkholderia phymatum STM815]|uniref:Glutathione S-transferase domain n=2 Tax=Paraburkholderia phymatum TaxID=148447 RepID=B2JWL4_PARP8|nr:Glutathione S-transferase domain [Paraburkholderia phymatum STM815]
MLFLHHSPVSVSSQKVRMALAEKGLEWTDCIVDLLTGEHCQPAFRHLNEWAEVPVLMHGDMTLVDSWLICEYLDDVVPQTPLMPATPHDRYLARHWNLWIEREVHEATGMLTYAVMGQPLLAQLDAQRIAVLLDAIPDVRVRAWRATVLEKGLDAPGLADAVLKIRRFVQRMESMLDGPHGWLAGNAFSLADVAALPYLMRAEHLGLGSLMTFEDHPLVRSWYLRMQSRPSMQPSLVRYFDADTQALMMRLVVDAQPKLEALVRATA